jgi:hypothetical protein
MKVQTLIALFFLVALSLSLSIVVSPTPQRALDNDRVLPFMTKKYAFTHKAYQKTHKDCNHVFYPVEETETTAAAGETITP